MNLDEIERRASRRSDSFADREEFNLHARTDVPALIARVRELEAELAELWTRYKALDAEDDNLREALAGAMDGWRCR
jgi:molecular chaperone GrpE (heat shock protein)